MDSGQKTKITIIGSGAWASAFGFAIGGESEVTFCARNAVSAQEAARKANGHWQLTFQEAAQDAELIIIGVSTGGFVEALQQAAMASVPVFWLTKGFTRDGRLLSEAAADILPPDSFFGALSGPTFADEVVRGLPAAMVAAGNTPQQLPKLQTMLHRKMLRLYPSEDLTGVCVAGALKNVIAIAAGICDGLQLGANARAAVITRGLAEVAAFNQAAGGNPETLSGIAGIGDFLLTCTSDLSRNRQFGLALGKGQSPPDMTAEGKTAATAAHNRARKEGLELPIIAATHAVLQENLPPAQAAEMLLSRPPPGS